MKNNSTLHTIGDHHFKDGSEKFCGVREDPRDKKQAHGAYLHNFDMETRKMLAHINEDLVHLDSEVLFENPKYNYDIHNNRVEKHNSDKAKKDKLDIETSIPELKFYSKGKPLLKSSEEGKKASAAYIQIKKEITKRCFENKPRILFDTYSKEQREEELKERLFKEHSISYETKVWKFDQNSSMFEQVLYFSNSINDEDISNEQYKQLGNAWIKHMVQKYNVIIIDGALHKSEKTNHFHFTGSNLDPQGNYLGNRLQTQKGYGSELQTDFADIVKQVLPDLKHEYKRGNKKAIKGNDHSHQNEALVEANQVIKIVDNIETNLEDGATNIDSILENIQGLKASYSNNKLAKKLLNLLQRTIGQIKKELDNSEEKNIELSQDLENATEAFKVHDKAFGEKLDEAYDELGEADELIEEIKDFFENSSSDFKRKAAANKGGKSVLKKLGIKVAPPNQGRGMGGPR